MLTCHLTVKNLLTLWFKMALHFSNSSRNMFWKRSTFHDYRVSQKIRTISLYALTLPDINRFSEFFHCQKQEKIRNKIITKDPTTPQVCHYTTVWNVKCLKSQNWKQDDFRNNTFKKTNNRKPCLLSELGLLSKLTVTSCSFTSDVQCVRLAAGQPT